MSNLTRYHFLYLDEDVRNKTLEGFALKAIAKKQRILYIDRRKNADDCIKSYSSMSKRLFKKAMFLETDSYDEIMDSIKDTTLLYVKHYYSCDEEDLTSPFLREIIQKTKDEMVILLDVAGCNINLDVFKILLAEASVKNIQIGIRTEDVDFFDMANKIEGIASYKTAKNIAFL